MTSLMTFPLSKIHVPIKSFLKTGAISAIISALIALLIGVLPDDLRFYAGVAFGTILLTSILFVVGRESAGVIELNRENLVVRGRPLHKFYAWEDIASIQVKSLRSSSGFRRFIAGLIGRDLDALYADVEFRCRPRYNPWTTRYGTSINGIPLWFMRADQLYAEDVHAFVEAAGSFLTSRD